jgi:hypothetical protein
MEIRDIVRLAERAGDEMFRLIPMRHAPVSMQAEAGGSGRSADPVYSPPAGCSIMGVSVKSDLRTNLRKDISAVTAIPIRGWRKTDWR